MSDQNNQNAAGQSVQTSNSEVQAEQHSAEQPNHVTVEQMNAAITARNRELVKEISSMKDLLSRLAPPAAPQEPTKNPTNKDEIAQLKEQMAAIRAEKEAEMQKRMDSELRTSVKDALSAMGVKPGLLKAALATLIDSDKMIGFSEEGQVVYRDPKMGELDLKSGLKEWSRTPEAREFISARGTVGSGEKRVNAASVATPKNQSQDEDSFDREAVLKLEESLRKFVR